MLKAETERLWQWLQNEPLLGRFILVGGSALSLRIGHRVSEDLDLVFNAPKLPRVVLARFVARCQERGFPLRAWDNPADLDEFLLAGEDLNDYQQDFLAPGEVRLSFFVADREMLPFLKSGLSGSVRLAEIEEVFRLKCLVSAKRSKTRDWLDLYILMTRHGFTFRDYAETFQLAGVPEQLDLGLARLCGGRPPKDDEGYESLLPDPPSLEHIAAFFRAQRDLLEVELAQKAFEKKPES
jgi:hypothetical protein